MKKKIKPFLLIVYIFLIISIIEAGVVLLLSANAFLFCIILLTIGGLIALIKMYFIQKDTDRFILELSEDINIICTDSLLHFHMPLVVIDENDEVVWNNEQAHTQIFTTTNAYGFSLEEMGVILDYKQKCPENGFHITLDEKMYSVYTTTYQRKEKSYHSLLFLEDTQMKKYYNKYFESRSCIMIIVIDNYEELSQIIDANERGQIISKIDHEIEMYIKQYGGLIRKVDREKFIVVLEHKDLEKIIENRFSILDSIRKIDIGNIISATLSIGVGMDSETLSECENRAKLSLDMSLGRGGDQAAIKTSGGYDFYGGVSKGIEKRTKVKTRIVATALMEIISASDHVIIMGHKFADLDCFGASLGMLRACSQLEKDSYIAIDKKRNLVGDLYDKLIQNSKANSFIELEQARDMITDKTVLIIVDTHSKAFLEFEEVYSMCKNVVVIDHHRKMVDHIDNAVIFHHEPFASSASEMVSEIIQYLPDKCKPTVLEAEALLAGIMLDTKNFVIKTGIRTFEAAAYLKKMGADTLEVRKLFASSMTSYQKRSRLVASAEIYKGFAICLADDEIPDIKIVAPQAADELLHISNVEASFVLYEFENAVNFSARSMGDVNVQLIMESLGGGGHQTMAGANLYDISIDGARQKLIQAIDIYNQHKQEKEGVIK